MYFRYTKLFDAYCVFEDMIERDLLIWTSMMKGYSDCGYGDEALCLVQKMLHECMFPDKVFFMNALCGCRSLGLLRSGLLLHLFIINANVDLDPLLGSSLVNMYAKFGSMQLVYNFFDKVNIKDTAFWTALLSGYEQQGENQKVLLVFSYMSTSAVHLNEASLLSAMQACTDLPTLDLGVLVHSIIVESGFESNAHLVNALIEMYARYGKEKDMHVVLKLSNRDAVTGNSIIDGVTKD
ncbi:hypothetical protein KP509_07G041800 [Ceratopteris richardii]|nr:hypothetical protein KP509_07G041800 [Ceratopteris richardii]